jgi:hypothetical protein
VKLCVAIALLTLNLRSATYGRFYSRITKAMSKSSLLITLVTVFVLPVASAQPNKSVTIHQEIDFNTSPQLLYEALLDANQFTVFSGRPAENQSGSWRSVLALGWPHYRAECGIASESQDRSGLARRDLA